MIVMRDRDTPVAQGTKTITMLALANATIDLAASVHTIAGPPSSERRRGCSTPRPAGGPGAAEAQEQR